MQTIKQLELLLRHFFMDDLLCINEATVASDIFGWDSLAHISLIVAVEKNFGVKFTTREVENFKNIGGLVAAIDAKRK